MQFAEVFLRLGSALVAWMLLYTHFLWLAALHAMGCGPDGDEMHKLLLGLVPLTCGAAVLIRITRPFDEIHRMLRWLAAPLLLLLPFALRSVADVAGMIYSGGTGPCGAGSATGWLQFWVPAQLLMLILSAWMMLHGWRDRADRSGKMD